MSAIQQDFEHACQIQDFTKIEKLLRADQDRRAIDVNQYVVVIKLHHDDCLCNIFHLAIIKQQKRIITLLQERIEGDDICSKLSIPIVYARNKTTRMADFLDAAAIGGDVDIMKWLIEIRADLRANVRYNMGLTALHWAAELGHTEIATLLLDNGFNVNVIGFNKRYTPLHQAVCSGHFNVFVLLLSRGADVNMQDLIGFSPLMYAIQVAGREQFAEYLLRHQGIKLQLQDQSLNTVLHGAANEDSSSFIHLLWNYAENNVGQGNVSRQGKGNRDNSLFWRSIMTGNNMGMRMAYQYNLKPLFNICNEYDEMPLETAAIKNRMNAFIAFIECGALLNTPLAQALRQAYLAIWNVIVDKERTKIEIVKVLQKERENFLSTNTLNEHREVLKIQPKYAIGYPKVSSEDKSRLIETLLYCAVKDLMLRVLKIQFTDADDSIPKNFHTALIKIYHLLQVCIDTQAQDKVSEVFNTLLTWMTTVIPALQSIWPEKIESMLQTLQRRAEKDHAKLGSRQLQALIIVITAKLELSGITVNLSAEVTGNHLQRGESSSQATCRRRDIIKRYKMLDFSPSRRAGNPQQEAGSTSNCTP